MVATIKTGATLAKPIVLLVDDKRANLLALGTSGGIAWEKMLELIGESVVASPVVKYKLDPVRRHDYTPTATTSLVLKDVDLMVAAAKAQGVELPLAAAMQALFRRALEQGLSERDFFSVVEGEKR